MNKAREKLLFTPLAGNQRRERRLKRGSGEMDDYVILITQLSLSTRRNNNYNISHFLPYLRDIR